MRVSLDEEVHAELVLHVRTGNSVLPMAGAASGLVS